MMLQAYRATEFLLHKKTARFITGSFYGLNYSATGAPTGHSPAHAPHSKHLSASITNLSSPSAIHSAGHTAAHAPHEMQSSLII